MTVPDNALAIIDATNAEVLAPESAPAALTVQQTEQLERCQTHLQRLGKSIAARENGLIYLYIEAGFYLLKSHEIHRCPTVGHRSDGTFQTDDGGFRAWLERPEIGLSKSVAYRYMQGAKNCGLTADSHIINLQAIKDTRKLNGQTLTALCRKPVDKDDKQAEVHDVTDEEQAALDEEERNERWEAIAGQLHQYGIEADEWAKLGTDRRAGLYDVLTELVKRIKPSLRKGKPAPAVPALPDKAQAEKPHPWRVGQREGQTRWQIKKAPGWGVVHEVDSIEQAATWLSGHGTDLATVDVLTVAPWPTLAAHLEANPAKPAAVPEPDGGPPLHAGRHRARPVVVGMDRFPGSRHAQDLHRGNEGCPRSPW